MREYRPLKIVRSTPINSPYDGKSGLRVLSQVPMRRTDCLNLGLGPKLPTPTLLIHIAGGHQSQLSLHSLGFSRQFDNELGRGQGKRCRDLRSLPVVGLEQRARQQIFHAAAQEIYGDIELHTSCRPNNRLPQLLDHVLTSTGHFGERRHI